MSKKSRRLASRVLAFLIPVMAMLLVYLYLGIYPFGEKALLCNDMQGQYVAFFSYLKGIFNGGNSFFYSLSKTLGGDLAGFSAYYLLSPFNLIFLLTPQAMFAEAVMAVTLLKIGACGFTMHLFLQKQADVPGALAFSTAYALMAYTIVYQQNLMWLDGVILLPLVALGLQRLVRENRFFLYTAALSFAIIVNYYIGFMLCLFSIVLFAYFLLEEKTRHSRSGVLSGCAVFAGSSVLAGGIAAVVLLPALCSLSGGKATFTWNAAPWASNFNGGEFLSCLFPGGYQHDDIMAGLPNIFCGTLILLFCLYYFLVPTIAWKEKLASGGVLLLMFLSMRCYAANLFWHGLNEPVWFPYRYSFLFSFFLILLAWRGFQKCERLQMRKAGIGALGLLLLTGAALFVLQSSPHQRKGLLIAFAAAIVYSGLCWRLSAKRSTAALCLLLALHCGELACNACLTLKQMDYADRQSFYNIVEEKSDVLAKLQKGDPGLYRIENCRYAWSYNDPMLFGYPGLSHYSSSEKQAVTDFMKKMGYQDNHVYAHYGKGSTTAADSFLGLRYLLTREPVPRAYSFTVEDGVYIYRNPAALPLAFLAQPEAENVSTAHWNLFQIQNDLWKGMTGGEKDIFEPAIPMQITLENLTQGNRGGSMVYTKQDAEAPASITYSFRAKDSRMLYAYFPSDELHRCELLINGAACGNTFSGAYHKMIILGSFQAGEEVALELRLTESSVVMDHAFFYYEDQGILENYAAALTENPVDLLPSKATEMRAAFTNDQPKLLVFTIPADDAWEIRLDGNPAEQTVLLDTLLAIKVPPGTHVLEMKYHPKGLAAGAVISLISLAALASWLTVQARKKKKEAGKTE